MAPKGSKEPLDWSPWEWHEGRKMWRSKGTNRRGDLKETKWIKSAPTAGLQDSPQDGQHEEPTPANYLHTGGNVGYPAETSTPRSSTVLASSNLSSGFQAATPTRHVIFQTSAYEHPAGWGGPLVTTEQFDQPAFSSSLYSNQNYNEQRPPLSYSDPQPAHGPSSDPQIGDTYDRGQNAALYGSMGATGSHHQIESQNRSNWPSSSLDTIRRDPTASSGSIQQNYHPDNTLTSDYQDDYVSSGHQATTPGFGSNLAPSKWSAASHDISQSRHTHEFTTPLRSGQSGFEGSLPLEEDPIDKKIREITDAPSRSQDKRSSQEVQYSQEPFISQRQDSYETLESDQNASQSEYRNDSGDERLAFISKSSHRSRSRRRSSVAYPREARENSALLVSRDSQKYTDDVARVTLQTASMSLGDKASSLYNRPTLSTNIYQESFTTEEQVPQNKSRRTSSYIKDSVDNTEKPQMESRKSHRRKSEVQRPNERAKDSSKTDSSRQRHRQREHQTPASPEPRKPENHHRDRPYPQLSYNNKGQLLDSRYKKHDSKFFHRGGVFKTLWSEPLGDTNETVWEEAPTYGNNASVENAKYGEKAYHSVRRFAIVGVAAGHSVCLPILTYQYKGTMKPGVKPKDHAIIYTGECPPEPLNGEVELEKRPIRVDTSSNGGGPLFPESRINYSKVYTVEHNVKVCFIGKIHKDSEAHFYTDFAATWERMKGSGGNSS